MKLLLAILVLVVFAISFVADYKWRKWMARRRAEHSEGSQSDPTRHSPGSK